MAEPDPTPTTGVASALPSTGARVLAFLAILVGGICGGLIGYAITDLQCSGDCSTGKGVGGLIGAAIGAVGVAVVAVLALRAMGEWKTIQERGGEPPRRTTRRS
jgi:CDP-diglyceride synthetase